MNKDPSKAAEPGADDRKALGEKLREAREYLGFSQEEIAASVGISRSALSLIESGQRKVEALELKKLAALYKRPVGHFTGEEPSSGRDPDIQHLARKAAALSPEDREELSRFADFLHMRKREKGE